VRPTLPTLRLFVIPASLSALLLLFLLAPPARAGKPTSPDEAKALYLKKCSPCHGKEGKSVPIFAKLKIPSFADAAWQAAHGDEELREAITKGRPGTAMRAFGEELSKDDIEALLRHIRSLAPKG
jgi:cytochrome c553